MTKADPQLYEAICAVERFPGRLHVPLLRVGGRWLNAITGHPEPWVHSVETMAPERAEKFAAGARYLLSRLKP